MSKKGKCNGRTGSPQILCCPTLRLTWRLRLCHVAGPPSPPSPPLTHPSFFRLLSRPNPGGGRGPGRGERGGGAVKRRRGEREGGGRERVGGDGDEGGGGGELT
eukprot:495369-Rhodomonas_salina.1